MRITSKGQVTIPIEIREKAGFLPNTEVDFVYDGETVTLVRSDRHVLTPEEAKRAIQNMVVVGRRARAAGQTTGMTTDEIMKLTRGE